MQKSSPLTLFDPNGTEPSLISFDTCAEPTISCQNGCLEERVLNLNRTLQHFFSALFNSVCINSTLCMDLRLIYCGLETGILRAVTPKNSELFPSLEVNQVRLLDSCFLRYEIFLWSHHISHYNITLILKATSNINIYFIFFFTCMSHVTPAVPDLKHLTLATSCQSGRCRCLPG